MKDLLPAVERIATLLKDRQESIAIAESSAGGLLSAALLAVPGASSYFLGGGVIYTAQARQALLGIDLATFAGIRPSTEAYALLLARTMRQKLGSSWGLAETGASGPTGNRYGDKAGHSCLAISGPQERALTIETSSDDRLANMHAFASAALGLLEAGLMTGN
jgi:nicotinamide-nucleotide amidase